MIVVIEGTMADVIAASRGVSPNAIVGTLAAWTLRYCPFVFLWLTARCRKFSFRFLAAQVRDAKRMAKVIAKERATYHYRLPGGDRPRSPQPFVRGSHCRRTQGR